MLINSSSNLILGRYSSYYLAPFLSWKVHKTLFLPQFPLFLWNLKHSMHWPTNRPNWVLSAPMISVNFHRDHFLVLLPQADIKTTPPLSPVLRHSHGQPGSLSLSLNYACWTWVSHELSFASGVFLTLKTCIAKDIIIVTFLIINYFNNYIIMLDEVRKWIKREEILAPI
jgi:hypothetical protein